MSERSFDDSEHISHGEFERHDEALKQESWEKMERLLDEDKRKRRVAFWWWLLPCLFLAGSSAIILHHLKNTKATGTQSVGTIARTHDSVVVFRKLNQTKTGEQESGASTARNTIDPANKQPVKPAQDDNNTETGTVSTSPVKSRASISQPIAAYNQPALATPSSKSRSDASSKSPGRKNLRTQSKPQLSKTAAVSDWKNRNTRPDFDMLPRNITTNSPKIDTEAKPESLGGNAQEVPLASALRPGISGSTTATAVTIADSPGVKNLQRGNTPGFNSLKQQDSSVTAPGKTARRSASSSSRISFGLVGSADLTSVGYKKLTRPGTAYGLAVLYRISKRWSVNTGLVFAKKLYLADSTNYKKVYMNGWTPTILKIDANCQVIEIPVNVQYMVRQGKSLNWYLNAGLSSYFMKNESYDYTIFYSNMEHLVNYSYKNQSNHRLAVLNLVMDMERKLGNGFALRLSPFVKMPLTGIGVGSVSLQSAGLQGAVFWSPNRHKTQARR